MKKNKKSENLKNTYVELDVTDMTPDGNGVGRTAAGVVVFVPGALTGDLDADGTDELALLVWRRGFYGPSRPFWREADAAGRVYTQHIFLYDWQPDGVQPFWMSSGLDPQVAAWAIADDGTLAIRTAGGEDTRWAWRSWGLERIDAPARKM